MTYTIIDRRASALGGQRKDRALSAITTIGWHYSAVMRSVRKFITGLTLSSTSSKASCTGLRLQEFTTWLKLRKKVNNDGL